MSKDKCQLEKVLYPGSFKKRLAEAEIKYQSRGISAMGQASFPSR